MPPLDPPLAMSPAMQPNVPATATAPNDTQTPQVLQQESAALDNISQMLVGTQMLKDQPGVVFALQQQNARPQDAQAIDQFMQGLDAEKQVRLAEASGQQIPLSDQQKSLLGQLGVDYSKVEYTPQAAVNDAAKMLEQQSGGKVQLQRDAQGNAIVDANGQFQQITQAKHHQSFWGRVVHDLNNWTLKPIGKAFNVVDQTIGEGISSLGTEANSLGIVGDLVDPFKAAHDTNALLTGNTSSIQAAPNLAQFGKNAIAGVENLVGASPEQRQQMKDAGYDPSNPFSILAFRASGKDHADLTPLAQKWDEQNPSGLYGWNGQQAINAAQQFLNNPKKYEQSIEQNPAFTPQQVADQLAAISSPQFVDLARRVQASSSSIGNSIATAIGIDPVKHPTEYAITSAGSDFAASLAVDPTLVAGKIYSGIKLGRIGMDTVADAAKAARAYDPAVSTGFAYRGLQARTQGYLDAVNAMGDAQEAGDVARAAALEARISTQYKELAGLNQDILGKSQLRDPEFWKETVGANGKPTVDPTTMYGEGDRIRTLGEFANYVSSKYALNRLMSSAAAVQSSLLPGGVSQFGLRALRGNLAEWTTYRAANRSLNAEQEVLTAAQADPALARSLANRGIISEEMLSRVLPQADDAANAYDGTTIASKTGDTGTQLASAQRGQLALTAAGKGEIAFNLRRYGTPLGTTSAGWATPTAIAERAKLAATRLSSLLPRNSEVDLYDASTSDKLFKFARTYLNQGDSYALKAAYDNGDESTRKNLIHAILDQVGHAAGLGKSSSGQLALDAMKTKTETYSTVGDEVRRNGDALALHPGQVQVKWTLPSFRDLQKASAKFGLWDATMGRALTSNLADTLMAQWKLGALGKPSTVTRNQIEGWGRTALEGKFGDAVRAKAIATLPNKELFALGHGQDDLEAYRSARGQVDTLNSQLKAKDLTLAQRAEMSSQLRNAKAIMAQHGETPAVQYLLATEAGNTKLAREIENSSALRGDALGRSGPTTRLAQFAPFALAGRAYRLLYGMPMNAREIEAINDLAPELPAIMAGYGQQATDAALGFRSAAKESAEISKAGFGSASLKRALQEGKERAASTKGRTDQVTSWTQHETDGTLGADRYSNALAQRFNTAPSIYKAIFDRLEDPEQFQVGHVVQALDDPAVAKLMARTAYGKVFWENPDGEAIAAHTPAEVALGKQEWAQKMINDVHYLLTAQGGEGTYGGRYLKEIADYVRVNNAAPSADWITSNLKNLDRPVNVLAPEVTAEAAKGGIKGLMDSLLDVEGAGYQWMVERPLQRTTSSPVFLANYAKARIAQDPYVAHLVEQGISTEAAGNLAKEMSVRNAYIKAEQLIDDPGQKTQFDIVARNIFPFSRAMQAMIRRWGGGLWQDPFRARKMMLAYEGAVHSGFIYTNTYGEPTFVYPGSGVMNMMLREVAKIPGFESVFHFPVSASMTGGVLMSVPGADNPFRMSAGPMVMIPLREISKLLPGNQRLLFDEIDSKLNGPVGQGQTFGTLVPTVARRFYAAMSTDDRNSALASSTIGAISNLAAAGQLPPQDATPAQRQEFLSRIQTQVRSQLFLRAAFGIFAPASPSQPSEGTAQSGADYAFHLRGVGQLSDEYKTILNDVNGDVARGNAIWNALHPDDTVYEIAHSASAATKASLPATTEALQWMDNNAGFIHKYGTVAAYFLPEGTANQPFSDQAYKTQIELGLRQRKTAPDFLNEIYVRNAESVFYPAVAQFDAKILAAKNAGDNTTASQWTQAKSDWETQFKNLNPLFQAKIDSYSSGRAVALGQLQNLRQMLQSGDVPDGNSALLTQLLAAYDGLDQFSQAHKGSTTVETQARSEALAMFNAWAKQNITGTQLEGLFDGVFRVLNTNLANLAATPTAGG